MAQTRLTSQFQAEVEGGPWTGVEIWNPDDPLGPINGQVFEVGEPVHIARPRGATVADEVPFKIWYLVELDKGPSGHRAMVGATRTRAELRVEVTALVKLEPLLRLAAESDGPHPA